MDSAGTLYLVPVPVSDGAWHTLSPEVLRVTERLRYYVAENARTARRTLRALHAGLKLEDVQISEIDKHQGLDKDTLTNWMKAGYEVGVLSEAGCPGVADPGSEAAALAHRHGANVRPLTGPSALLLALMGSGLDGQSFAFNGYLPVKGPQRDAQIKTLEQRSIQLRQTQLFIETPYRNQELFSALLATLRPDTRLCVAQDITGAQEFIRTRSTADWNKHPPTLHRVPTVFLIQGT